MGGDNILTLTTIFFRVLRVSNGDSVSSAPTIEQSVMISERDRDRGHGRDFGGHKSFERGHGSYGGRQSGSDKGPRKCRHMGGIITSIRSVGRNLVTLNGYDWLILTLLPLVILLMLFKPPLLVLPLWYFHRQSMIGCTSPSSLKTTIQQLMHHLQV